MTAEQPQDWLISLLLDFDKRCPECQGEGHGGDGCEYCWNNNVELEAISKAKATILAHMNEAVLDENREIRIDLTNVRFASLNLMDVMKIKGIDECIDVVDERFKALSNREDNT